MNAKNRSIAKVGLAVSSALAVASTGCQSGVVYSHPPTAYVPAQASLVDGAAVPASQPLSVAVPPLAPTPVVAIQSESDFYQPLEAYGRWEIVAGYGRCWVPTRVEVGWRPYCNGYWQPTDAGWYWMSDEPWGWATYHYGRWDWHARFGWIWVPQTQWAPAWVCWREGGGYVGWAPLRPSVSIGVSFGAVDYEPAFASRAFVFVEHRRMLEPVRPRTVVINNTQVINQTVNITKVKVVNKNVINEGPRLDVIERESGRKVQTIPVHEFRHREEATVVAHERNIPTTTERRVQRPVPSEAQAVRAPEPPRGNVQTVEREPIMAKPIERAPQSVPLIARTTPAVRADVSNASRDQERRQAERTAKARAARAAEEKSRSDAQRERANPNRQSARTFERPAEVTKPAAPPVATSPAREEMRRKLITNRVASTTPTAEPRPRTEARTERTSEAAQPSRVQTAPPVVPRRAVAARAESQPQKPEVSSREKGRTERVEANGKKKEAKDTKKKGEERDVSIPTAGSSR